LAWHENRDHCPFCRRRFHRFSLIRLRRKSIDSFRGRE